jgi:hypothetical protein
MVIGVPPFSMGGCNYGHELATHTLRLSLEVNFSFCLLWGGYSLSLVEILGEEGEEGIGQYDHFVMV